jgi:hypothetical protein
MLTLALAAQLAATQIRDTATYATPAVRALVTEAARMNNRVPPTFGKYHATLESEISFGGRQSGGTEVSFSIEQVASDVSWTRTGDFEQHVTGYRSQSVGPQLATLGFFRYPWAVPSLYGNRLALLFGRDSIRRTTRRDARGAAAAGARAGGSGGGGARGGGAGSGEAPAGERTGLSRDPQTTTYAVHPLATDRERVYRFSGGDTVEKLTVGDREIRIVKIEVTPKANLPPRTAVFSGEVDLDVDRKNVVRMRGSFASTGDIPSGPFGVLKPLQLQGVVFVELVNSEVNQQYWLPSYQRFEAQAVTALFGDSKAVFRIVSRFRDYAITPPESTVKIAGSDTLRARPHVLSVAPRDSLSRFDRWVEDLGVMSAAASSEDFTDVAPRQWRRDGTPLVRMQAERVSDLARFNRVEGIFTGAGVSARMRDAAPGLTLRALGGYAWSERTVRGRASAVLERDAWTYALRAGRSLDITNDFRNVLDSGSSLGALFGQDDYDYVDRYSAGASATRTFARRLARARIEVGWADDRAAVNHVARGPIGGQLFLANRGVDEGNWLRSALTFEWHPDEAAEFMKPGFGVTLRYLRGDGQLNFQRAELRLNVRTNTGPWTFASRLDAGMVFGDPPPQQLFELGRSENLAGYDYKVFAGNQAVTLRGLAMYQLHLLLAPIRLTQRLWLPAAAPAVALSLQGGWTGASNEAARAAILRLGSQAVAGTSLPGQPTPVSTVTGNARESVSVGIRFFGGTVGLSIARPIDRAFAWKGQIDFGQLF